jgi:hypothetical protein
MSPRPINPMAGFKRCLLDGGRHATTVYSAQNEETIVAESRGGSGEGSSSAVQAVFGRWDSGRRLGAPPAEAAAAALFGSLASSAAGASGAVLGAAATETPFADVPESGFSSMRTRYWYGISHRKCLCCPRCSKFCSRKIDRPESATKVPEAGKRISPARYCTSTRRPRNAE